MPAPSGRVLAACTMRRGKSKVMSAPASGRPSSCVVDVHDERQVELAAVPGRAELVGRDRDRRERGPRLRLEEAEALRELRRDEIAQADVVASMRRRMCSAAFSRFTPIGTSSRIDRELALEIDAPVLALDGIASRGPRNASESPWYIIGSSRSSLVRGGGGPLPFPRVRAARLARRSAWLEVRRRRPATGRRAAAARRTSRNRPRTSASPAGSRFAGVVERLRAAARSSPSRRARPGASARRRRRRRDLEVAGDDAERAVARVVLQAAEFHPGGIAGKAGILPGRIAKAGIAFLPNGVCPPGRAALSAHPEGGAARPTGIGLA